MHHILLVALLAFLVGLGYVKHNRHFTKVPETTSSYSLREHNRAFPREVISVLPHVHVAVGYALANSILIETQRSWILIDTSESMEAAQRICEAFAATTTFGLRQKPLEIIIYTHFHPDHCMGTQYFLEFMNQTPSQTQIIAHATFEEYFYAMFTNAAEASFRRASGQFGILLHDNQRINCGIGPQTHVSNGNTFGFVRPTRVFETQLKLSEGGVDLELFHVPGESEDQIAVWLPGDGITEGVLCPADTVYKSFPNLYAIRGTRHRNVMKWVHSLDLMRQLHPDILVPSHTIPVTGFVEIQDILTIYRDAIQYVHDQTFRWLNANKLPNELGRLVVLPPELQGHPYLREWYGKVEWSAKAIFHGEMGWFSGRALDLHPQTPQESAEMLLRLAGDSKHLLRFGEQELKEKRFQASLEIAEALVILKEYPHEADLLKEAALLGLAQDQWNAPARNYYLSSLDESQGMSLAPDGHDQANALRTLRCIDFFQSLRYRFRAGAESPSVNVLFEFRDISETVYLKFRHSVMLVNSEDNFGNGTLVRMQYKELMELVQHPLKAIFTDIEIRSYGNLLSVDIDDNRNRHRTSRNVVNATTLGPTLPLFGAARWLISFFGMFDRPVLR